MGNLTKNISRHELACKCGCGFDSMDWETIEVVQECCDYFADLLGLQKVTLSINSASRCHKHNSEIGGAKQSQHLYSRAMDIDIIETTPENVYLYLSKKYVEKYGVGRYNTFTHIDTRSDNKRW